MVCADLAHQTPWQGTAAPPEDKVILMKTNWRHRLCREPLRSDRPGYKPLRVHGPGAPLCDSAERGHGKLGWPGGFVKRLRTATLQCEHA